MAACYDALENKGMEDDTVQNGITKNEARPTKPLEQDKKKEKV
jgi:hypothetical protein